LIKERENQNSNLPCAVETSEGGIVKNKMLLAMMLLLPVTIAVALSWTNVSAQGPVNTNPWSAVYLDNQGHMIPANTTLWYKFDYNGDRSAVEIKLFDGVPKQLQFNLYLPDQIGVNSVGNPVGRGMPPSGSNDLQWKGLFYGPGTFYIELINNTSGAQPFLLGIAGGGVTLRIQPPAPTPLPSPTRLPPSPPPSPTIDLLQGIMFPAIAALRGAAASTTAVATSAPVTPTVAATLQSVIIVVVTATPMPTPLSTVAPTPTRLFTAAPPPPPAPTAIPTPLNDWWTNAFYVVNGRTYTIPGNSERWFAFDYAGDRSKIEIRIPGGNEMKLLFRLFTQDQVLRYEVDGRPIGEGTAGLVTCDAGRCVSNDLVWAGDFMMNGTYFVQVTNFDPMPKSYQILVTGSGVVLGR
jgi:hypothetical protein